MGTVHNDNAQKDTFMYRRAFSSKNRNRIWRGVVSKTRYDVEIIWETTDKKEVFEKEKEFIRLYGRRDSKTGVLANLTDGGDGSVNLSVDVIKRTIAKNRANGCYEKAGKIRAELNRKFGNSYKGKERADGYHGFRKCFVYNSDGSFYGEFKSRKDASKALGIKGVQTICNAIKKDRILTGGKKVFNEYMGDRVNIIEKRLKPVYKICPNTGIVLNLFKSAKDALNSISVGSNVFCQAMKEKRIYKGFIWSFTESVNISEYRPSRIVSPRGTKKTTCAKCGGEKVGKMLTYSYCHKCSANRMRGLKYKYK